MSNNDLPFVVAYVCALVLVFSISFLSNTCQGAQLAKSPGKVRNLGQESLNALILNTVQAGLGLLVQKRFSPHEVNCSS